MEAELWAVMGLLVLVLLVASVLTIPNFVHVDSASAFKAFYERYLDVLVVSLAAAVSLLALGFGVGFVLPRATPKDVYILAGLFLLAIRSVLVFVESALSRPGTWLVSSVSHLFDLVIVAFLILALRERE